MRPGMIKVSSDDRREGLVLRAGSLCSVVGRNERMLFDFCILMPVCMLHDESWKVCVDGIHLEAAA